MNIVSTGYSIAAAIEPTDTICVNIIRIRANTKQISPICQFDIISTPSDVATPFPPLNLKNIGNVCPRITATPAICTNNAPLEFEKILFISIAISIETTPFNMSQNKVIAAAFFSNRP